MTTIFKSFYEAAGGRKMTLLWVGFVVAVLNEMFKLGLDDNFVENILMYSVGGSAVVSFEDFGKHIGNGKAPSPTT